MASPGTDQPVPPRVAPRPLPRPDVVEEEENTYLSTADINSACESSLDLRPRSHTAPTRSESSNSLYLSLSEVNAPAPQERPEDAPATPGSTFGAAGENDEDVYLVVTDAQPPRNSPPAPDLPLEDAVDVYEAVPDVTLATKDDSISGQVNRSLRTRHNIIARPHLKSKSADDMTPTDELETDESALSRRVDVASIDSGVSSLSGHSGASAGSLPVGVRGIAHQGATMLNSSRGLQSHPPGDLSQRRYPARLPPANEAKAPSNFPMRWVDFLGVI